MKSPIRHASIRACLLVFAAVSGLQSCAGFGSDYEAPTVTVNSFRSVPSGGALPDFEIGLHIVNPNRAPLELEGVSYTIRLGGEEIIKGVSNQLPVIDGYGEGDIVLTASANLFAGIRLVTDMLDRPAGTLPYELEAKLDPGGFRPTIRIRDSGELKLNR